MITATWCISSNVGDRITPFLIERITGERPIYSPPTEERILLGCGSILNWARPKNIVWGAGLASFTDEVDAGADIRSVRGPLSRARAISCGCSVPVVFGDPALLLPRIVDRAEAVAGRIGLVAHYIDQQRAQWWYGSDERITIINALQGVESFVRELTACEFVFSSSLHGLIIADAYGIPNAWVRISDSVGGDGMKFMDHQAAGGRPIVEPIDLRPGKTNEDHPLPLDQLESLRSRPPGTVDTGAIWDACPLKNGGLQ